MNPQFYHSTNRPVILWSSSDYLIPPTEYLPLATLKPLKTAVALVSLYLKPTLRVGQG